MGVYELNKYIKQHAKNSTKLIHFSELSNKKIAIDATNYIYKFSYENKMFENMIAFCSNLFKHNIQAIFVFDGKPTNEKMPEILKRKNNKINAAMKYNQLINENKILNEDNAITQNDINKKEISKLKRIMTTVSNNDVEKVKQIVTSLFGFEIINALGEADEVCANLSLSNYVWGCMSEDTDMLVYGCKNVLRYISILNENAVLYETENILKELNINKTDFVAVCVLSGNDYIANQCSIQCSFELYNNYLKTTLTSESNFCKWLIDNKYINDDLTELFLKSYNHFNDEKKECNVNDYLKDEKNKQNNFHEIIELLENIGFIFA